MATAVETELLTILSAWQVMRPGQYIRLAIVDLTVGTWRSPLRADDAEVLRVTVATDGEVVLADACGPTLMGAAGKLAAFTAEALAAFTQKRAARRAAQDQEDGEIAAMLERLR
jgi:hypothetical protein